MTSELRCPRCGLTNRTVAGLSTALLAIGQERSVHATLCRVVEAARHVANARWGALGIAGEDGALTQLIASGEDNDPCPDAGVPPTVGFFRLALESPLPLRIPVLAQDPRAADLPPALAQLRSFLGMPLRTGDDVLGAFYLFGRLDAPAFTAADQEGVQMLASHAILAIDNARLHERSRELTVVEERNRLARELHDAVSQTLFSIVFTARSAATLLERDRAAAAVQVAEVQRLAQDAQREMRSLIFELRPSELEREGLVATFSRHIETLRQLHPAEIELHVVGEPALPARVEKELFRIGQEALSNTLKHSDAAHVHVSLQTGDGRTLLEVRDDGTGFDPEAVAALRRVGLSSMRERAELLGGVLRIDTAPGSGTRVAVEVRHER